MNTAIGVCSVLCKQKGQIAPLFEDRILGKMEIEKLMDKYGLSRRRVFQLLKRAKEIGQEA